MPIQRYRVSLNNALPAGDLRHRLTFQTNTPTANSIGEFVDTYADSFTVWGSVTPLTGRLLFSAQQANSEATGMVKVRYRSDIDVTMRIKFGSRYLKILSIINPDERNEHLEILYKEALD